MLRQNPSAKMIAWNRAVIEDIEQSIKCGFSYIHESRPISELDINDKFKKDRQWILQQLQYILEYVSDKNVKLLVGAEDASRADPDFFLQYAEVAAKYGAIRIRYADTIESSLRIFEAAKGYHCQSSHSQKPEEVLKLCG